VLPGYRGLAHIGGKKGKKQLGKIVPESGRDMRGRRKRGKSLLKNREEKSGG